MLFAAAKKLIESRSLNNPSSTLSQVFAAMYGSDSTDNGIAINAEATAGYPPVSQGVGMIAADCAALPMNVFHRQGKDREKDTKHPAHKLINLHGAPNDYSTGFDFWFDVFTDALLRGKGLVWVERRGALPIGLYRLDPDSWRPVMNGRRKYWANYGEVPIVWPDADILVIRGVCLDGLNPDNPIRLYADTLRVGVSTQRFASRFFGNGAHVGGILQAPPGASEKAIDNVEAGVRAKENPNNWFKTLVLRDGFRWQSTTVDPKAASLAEVDESTVRQVARIYNIPPSRLGISSAVSYNSLEQDDRRYFNSTLTPWLRRLQGQANQKLLLPSEFDSGNYFIEHHVDALQWADTTTRAAVATQGISARWLLPSEVRRWHNLPPLTDEDRKEFGAAPEQQPETEIENVEE